MRLPVMNEKENDMTEDTVIITAGTGMPPTLLYRLISTNREVFEIAADTYWQDLAGVAGWFYFSIAGKVVFQVLAAQVFVILLAYDEMPDEQQDPELADHLKVSAEQDAVDKMSDAEFDAWMAEREDGVDAPTSHESTDFPGTPFGRGDTVTVDSGHAGHFVTDIVDTIKKNRDDA